MNRWIDFNFTDNEWLSLNDREFYNRKKPLNKSELRNIEKNTKELIRCCSCLYYDSETLTYNNPFDPYDCYLCKKEHWYGLENPENFDVLIENPNPKDFVRVEDNYDGLEDNMRAIECFDYKKALDLKDIESKGIEKCRECLYFSSEQYHYWCKKGHSENDVLMKCSDFKVVKTENKEEKNMEKNNSDSKEKITSGEKTMLNEIFGSEFDFGEVTNVRLTFAGQIAIDTGKGRFKTYDSVKKSIIDTTELVMGGNNLIMKLPVQKVEEGDVIIKSKRFYFVKNINDDNEIKVVSLDDSKIEIFAPETNLFGINFFIKVVSVFNVGGGIGTINPMSMFIMQKITGNKSVLTESDDLMTILALTSLSNNGKGISDLLTNPMMMMLFCGEKESGLKSMLLLKI